MNANLVPQQSTEVVKLSRQEALEQVERAKVLLKESQPLRGDLEHYPGPDLSCFFGIISGITGLVIASISFLKSENSLGWVSLAVGIHGIIQSTVQAHLECRASDGKSFIGIWKPLSYIYATKKQRALAKEYAEVLVPYNESIELYSLLVERIKKELTDNGVFEVLNDVSNPDNDKFLQLTSYGEFQHISREEFEEEQLNRTNKNQEFMQELLMNKLRDEKPLLEP